MIERNLMHLREIRDLAVVAQAGGFAVVGPGDVEQPALAVGRVSWPIDPLGLVMRLLRPRDGVASCESVKVALRKAAGDYLRSKATHDLFKLYYGDSSGIGLIIGAHADDI